MTKTESGELPVTRLDVLSLIHAQCHRVYLSAINREEIDTKYMAEIEDALRRLAATTQASTAQADERNAALYAAMKACECVIDEAETPEESSGAIQCRDAIRALRASDVGSHNE